MLQSIFLAGAVLASAQDPAPKLAAAAFFNDHVETVLISRCLECHGDKREGELDLRTRPTALKGSENGSVIEPGNPDKSLLFDLIYDEKMPPKHPLPDEEVEVLKKWIADGLYYPQAPLIEPAPEQWWSSMPLVQILPPQSSNPNQQPIDRFIRAALKEKGLTPSSPTNPRTLIRRVTFDMHGLPPTPQEIDTFLKACTEESGWEQKVGDTAYSNLIDGLLASPRYGERWARHWLDIVHFGETHGFDKDQRRNNAWPYRDYVVRALNNDKPYAEFVTEQIAGDVLKPGHKDGIVAAGFLAAGPWDQVGQLEVREGTIEKKRVRNLDRDDIVTTVFNTFQSTTVQCARCHNHKFDPISRSDYYKLQAVFAGIDRADRKFEPTAVSDERKSLNSRIATVENDLNETRQSIQESLPEKYHALQKNLERLERKRESLQPKEEKKESPSNGYHSVIALTPDEPQWVEIDLGKSVLLDELRLIPARPTDYKDTPGFGFPKRLTVRISNSEKSDDFQTISDYENEIFPNPGDTPVVFNLQAQNVRRIRIDAYELWERNKDFAFALAEVEAVSAGENVALGKPVSASSSIDFGRWHTRYLVDGYDSRRIRDGNKTLKSEKLVAVESEIESTGLLAEKLVKRRAKKSHLKLEAAQKEAFDGLRLRLSELPEPNSVYSIGSIKIREIFDLPRGNEAAPGDQVFPEALSLIAGLPSTLENETDNESAARLELAKWIVDSRNALTWRSIANRVWQYHFGKGIVDTPNDFGHAGNPPTHPELLDWLAVEFRESGSLKDLHRLILNSATYRQSSAYNTSNAAIDGSNQFLWRMNTRKLDAESVHDTVLAVSGKLDLKMGGPSYEAFNYTHDHSPKYDFLGKDSPDVWRRSIYRFVVRSVPDPLFEALDCADPNMNTAVRNETLTAPQALAMLNDSFILKQAAHTAGRLTSEHEGLNEQIDQIFMLALGRPPQPQELTTLKQFAETHGLPSLARLTFNLNEFMFVD
ncbi:MAG: DUF1553 domain-containing protein [Candidatus Hydrogenedentota bacterium]